MTSEQPLIENKYGIVSTIPLCARDNEWWAFKLDRTKEVGGLGKYEHFARAAWLTWPQFRAKDAQGKPIYSRNWNPWLVRNLKAFCSDAYAVRYGGTTIRVIPLTGAAAAGKTQATALYSMGWWACDPDNSIAILTSTGKNMIRRRIWPAILGYHGSMADYDTNEKLTTGYVVDSKTSILHRKGDDQRAIFALAVAEGETQKALNSLKGMHAPRILVVIDEANGTPEAIFHAVTNLRKGCRDLTVIVIGNPVSHLDPHGRACEPIEGWNTVGVESEEWPTKGVPEWQLEPGICLRFDGHKSPNVLAGEDKYPYLYSIADYESSKRPGVDSTLGYWAMDRGMWPPDGFSNTIFNDALIARCNASDQFTFVGRTMKVAGLDPAFGGDGCILQFGILGWLENGKMALQLTDWMDVPISPEAEAHDVDYQISRRVIEECRSRGVLPECFALDATGIGRGVAAIIANEWSPKIQRTEWNHSATERPSSQNDGRPASEVYADYVTELWYAAREGLEAGQVKGFSAESLFEFCARQYSLRGKKYLMESKTDMKGRIKYSPDHSDACALVIESARRNGLEISVRISESVQRDNAKDIKIAQEALAIDGDKTLADGGYADQDIRIEMDFREVA